MVADVHARRVVCVLLIGLQCGDDGRSLAFR